MNFTDAVDPLVSTKKIPQVLQELRDRQYTYTEKPPLQVCKEFDQICKPPSLGRKRTKNDAPRLGYLPTKEHFLEEE